MDCRQFSMRQLIEMDGCTRCGVCVDWCPTCRETGEFGISPMSKIANFRNDSVIYKKLLGKIMGRPHLSLEDYSRDIYRCTLCGRCEAVCPVNLGLKEMWLSLRASMVHVDHSPQAVGILKQSIETNRNIVGSDNNERLQWVDGLPEPPADRFLRRNADVVYFVGCVASYYPMAFSVPRAITSILTAADISFTVLGGDEWCCGWPLFGAGLPETAEALVLHNIERIETLKARYVVCSCPSCYHTWQAKYPEYKRTGFKVFHESEFLDLLVKQGRLELGTVERSLTYHDPCDLGRASGIYEPPREVLRAIPGIELVEMKNNRDYALCCGGGGNLEAVDAELSDMVAGRKIDEIAETGTENVATACQQCKRTISTALRKRRLRVKVYDVCEIVWESVRAGKS